MVRLGGSQLVKCGQGIVRLLFNIVRFTQQIERVAGEFALRMSLQKRRESADCTGKIIVLQEIYGGLGQPVWSR